MQPLSGPDTNSFHRLQIASDCALCCVVMQQARGEMQGRAALLSGASHPPLRRVMLRWGTGTAPSVAPATLPGEADASSVAYPGEEDLHRHPASHMRAVI